MASRKEQKEQARLARLQAEQAAAEAKARTRRMQLIGGVVVIAIAVVAVVIGISIGNSGSGGIPTSKHQQSHYYAQVKSLLQGIPQSGTTLGQPSAKVTVTYYGDLECPICQTFTLTSNSFPELVQKAVRTGQVKVTYRSLCTATCHYNTSRFVPQQTAAYAAGKQNLFWDYAELFYRQQESEDSPYVTTSFLQGIADEIPNLNLKVWQQDREAAALKAQVNADQSQAAKLGISATPTLVVSGPKGTTPVQGVDPTSGVPNYNDIMTAVKLVA